MGRAECEYILITATTNTELTVENCGRRASTKKSEASKASGIATDIAKFAKGATTKLPGSHLPRTLSHPSLSTQDDSLSQFGPRSPDGRCPSDRDALAPFAPHYRKEQQQSAPSNPAHPPPSEKLMALKRQQRNFGDMRSAPGVAGLVNFASSLPASTRHADQLSLDRLVDLRLGALTSHSAAAGLASTGTAPLPAPHLVVLTGRYIWFISWARHDLAAIVKLRCERNSSSFRRKTDRCKQLRPRLHLGASFRDWYE